MRKKIAVTVIACVLFVAVAAMAVWGIKVYQRENDPYWQMAKKLYNVESALQEIDGDWKLESLSQVTPYHYQNPDGNTITYYCCTTTYVNDEPTEYAGIHKTALEQVIDIDDLENRRDCDVNGFDAVLGELDGKAYLCWTISPKYSCVIEYVPVDIDEADVFRMAQSVAIQSAG